MKTTENAIVQFELAQLLIEKFNSLDNWIIEEGFETIAYRNGKFPDCSKSLIQSINQEFFPILVEQYINGKLSGKSYYKFDFDEILVLKGSKPQNYFPYFHSDEEQEYTVCIPLNQPPIHLWQDYMDHYKEVWIGNRTIVLYDDECIVAQIRECSHSDDAYIILLRKNR
jgi:hypothetical protein